MDNIIAAIISAIITASITLYIHFSRQPKRRGLAYKVLCELKKKLESPKGEYCRTKTADDNFEIAQHLYKKVEGEIVATAFHENPANYGENDLVRLFRQRDFIRITCEEVCDKKSQKIAKTNLSKIHKSASLVVIPKGEKYVRVDGMFCRFRDETYLCFISFRNPSNPKENYGIIFREDIAEIFFDYFKELAKKYNKE